MRELIKTGAYSFVDGTRQITITDGRSFTASDILLIVNETQKVVLVSSMQKDNIVSVNWSVVTYSNALPALANGDVLNIQIDFPQKVTSIPIHTQYFNFTSTQGTFSITKSGTLTSVTDAIALMIKRVESSMAVELNLPATVSVGDLITATLSNTGQKEAVIQINSSSDSEISVGSLPAKIVTGCGNFAYYSNYYGKVLIGGLAVSTEDGELVNGDGDIGYNSYSTAEGTLNKKFIEYDGKLYYYSIERSSVIRLNLSNGAATSLGINKLPVKMYVSNGYLYFEGWSRGTDGGTMYGYDLTSLASFSKGFTNGYNYMGISTLGKDGAVYFMMSNQYLAKYVGSTYTAGTVGTVLNYQEFLVQKGIFVYGMNNTTIRKYNTSDCNLVASITVPAACYSIWSNADGSKLYCMTSGGIIYRIDVATFTRDTAIAYNTTVSSTNYPSIVINNNIAWIFSGSGGGTTNAQTFIKLDMTNNIMTIYSPANGNGLSLNTANALNIDTVNNRLIFYQVNRYSISQTNCEIINIP